MYSFPGSTIHLYLRRIYVLSVKGVELAVFIVRSALVLLLLSEMQLPRTFGKGRIHLSLPPPLTETTVRSCRRHRSRRRLSVSLHLVDRRCRWHSHWSSCREAFLWAPPPLNHTAPHHSRPVPTLVSSALLPLEFHHPWISSLL